MTRTPDSAPTPSSPNLLRLGIRGTLALGFIGIAGWGTIGGGAEAAGAGAYEFERGMISGVEKGSTIVWDQLTEGNQGIHEPNIHKLQQQVEAQKRRNEIDAAVAAGDLPPAPGPEQSR